MPSITDIIPNRVDEGNNELASETISLYLPSDFSPEDRRHLGLNSIATVELKLRKAEANDAIQELRTQINFNLGLEAQKKKVRYTKNLTRAAKIIQDAGRARDAVAESYRAARQAIVSLGGDGKDEFPTLSAQDLNVKSIKGGRDSSRKGKTTDSWIYKKVARLAGDAKTQDEWDKEGEPFIITAGHHTFR